MKLNDVLSKVEESTIDSLIYKLSEKIKNFSLLNEAVSDLQLKSEIEAIKKDLEQLNSLSEKQGGRLTRDQWKSYTDEARDWAEKFEARKPEVLASKDPVIKNLFALLIQQNAIFLKTCMSKQDNLIEYSVDENGQGGDTNYLINKKNAIEAQKAKQDALNKVDPNQFVNSRVNY